MDMSPLNRVQQSAFDYERDPKHKYFLTEALQSRYVLATH